MDTKCLWMIGVTALSSLEGGHMTASLSDFFVKHRQIVICLKHIRSQRTPCCPQQEHEDIILTRAAKNEHIRQTNTHL